MLKFIAVVSFTLFAAPAAADYCSEPDAPYCATRWGPFDDEWDFEKCKREMRSYADDVERYQECLRAAEAEAVSDFNEAVLSFNKRARGY